MAVATITVTRTFPNLETLQLLSEEDMREVGVLLRERIVRRTISGLDVDGAAFTPYSPDYFDRKSKELGLAVPVNLTVSGNMLNHLQIVAVDDHSVTLGWLQ